MPQAGSWRANKKHDGEFAEMSDVNRVMFDAAVIRAEEAGEHTTNEEWAIQYAAAEIESLTTQLAEARAERDALRQALETIRDAGLEPIDPTYRELARAALEGK